MSRPTPPSLRFPVVPCFLTSLWKPLAFCQISLHASVSLHVLCLPPLSPSQSSSAVMPFRGPPDLPPFLSSCPCVYVSVAGVVTQVTVPVPVGLLESYSESPSHRAVPRTGPGKLVKGVASGSLTEGPMCSETPSHQTSSNSSTGKHPKSQCPPERPAHLSYRHLGEPPTGEWLWSPPF